MKTLKEYLAESKKTYPFKIGIAGDLPEDIDSKLKTALEKYKVVTFKKGKSTPIQERPLDFPQLENVNVTFFEVEIAYPTTDAILQEYLGGFCSVERSHLIVRNPNSPVEIDSNTDESETYETLLTTTEMGGPSAQNVVGQSRVMDLLKELETASKDRPDRADSKFAHEATKKESENAKSVLGN